MNALAAACPYLAGCHPRQHAWIHHTHGHGGVLGGLLFVLLITILWHRITDGEWG